jgi:hypothetical protein
MPHSHATSCPSDSLFKLLALAAAVLVEFFKILNALFGRAEGGFLTLLSLKDIKF